MNVSMDEWTNLEIYRIRNEDIRKDLGVINIKEKMEEINLRWLRHVQIEKYNIGRFVFNSVSYSLIGEHPSNI